MSITKRVFQNPQLVIIFVYRLVKLQGLFYNKVSFKYHLNLWFSALHSSMAERPAVDIDCLAQIFLFGNKMKRDKAFLDAERWQTPEYPSSILGEGIFYILKNLTLIYALTINIAIPHSGFKMEYNKLFKRVTIKTRYGRQFWFGNWSLRQN